MKPMKILAATALLVISAFGLSGVASAQTANGTTKLRVGYIPVGAYSYFWRARDAGYFREENLDVELVPMAGGGEIIPALQSGSLDFGISDPLGVLNARNGGLQATFVSLNFSSASDDPIHAVLTMDPAVQTAADLAGKSVATNLSFNSDWIMMREWLRREQVDIDNVSFREIPFPDMIAALRSGVVSAAGVAEPFYTLGEAQGARVLGNYFTDVQSPVLLSGVIAMTPYVREHPDRVKKFVRAIDRAVDDFNANPSIVREVIAQNTKLPPEVLSTMNLGRWAKMTAADIQFWVDAARKEGIVTETTDLNSLIWQGE